MTSAFIVVALTAAMALVTLGLAHLARLGTLGRVAIPATQPDGPGPMALHGRVDSVDPISIVLRSTVPQVPPRPRSRMLALVDHHLPVDQHVFDPLAVGQGLLDRGHVVQLVASNLAPLYVQIRREGKSREEALVETLTAWSELCGMLERLPKGAPDI